MNDPTEPIKPKIERKRRAVDPADELTLENLPEADREIVQEALRLSEREKLRIYHGRMEERRQDQALLESIFAQLKTERGINLTLQQFHVAQMYAALDHARVVDPVQRRLHYVAGMIVEAVDERVRELLPDGSEQLNRGELNADVALDHYHTAKLQHEVNRDDLTGLLNKREAIHDRFVIERDRFIREADPDEVMLVVEIDIIKFKQLNDDLTNDVVDSDVLTPLGRTFSQHFRGNDIRCRLGGDEFTIIFNRVKQAAVNDLLKNVLNVIESAKYGKAVDGRKITARVGAKAMTREDVQMIPTKEAESCIKALRRPALIAAAQVKRLMSKGGTKQVLLWTAEMDNNEQDLQAVMIDDFMRENSAAIARIRKRYGDKIALIFEEDIKRAFIKAMGLNDTLE